MKYTTNGKAVANASIAINDEYGDNATPTFLPVVMWGKTAENTAEYSKKGKLVAIEGKVKVRKWDSDNGTRYITEIIADNVRFLESNRQHNQTNQDPFQGEGQPIDIDDRQLPF